MRLLATPIKPKPDQIFSSWVCENALAQGVSLNAFNRYYFKNPQMVNRDIDKYSNKNVWDLMAEITGVDSNVIKNMILLKKLKNVVTPSINMTNSPWITHVNNIFNTNDVFGNCFCPECLLNDEQPYLRLNWRLAFFTFCPEHRALLHDRCFQCGSPISLYRLPAGSGRLECCYKCNVNHCYAPRKEYEITSEQIRIQQILLSLLCVPKAEIPGGKKVSTNNFFKILHDITYLIYTAKELAPIVNAAKDRIISRVGSPSDGLNKHKAFECCRPEERLVLLTIAFRILHIWPCNFNFECIYRHVLGGRRTYPLSILPCKLWCDSTKHLPFNRTDCKQWVEKLREFYFEGQTPTVTRVGGVKNKMLEIQGG